MSFEVNATNSTELSFVLYELYLSLLLITLHVQLRLNLNIKNYFTHCHVMSYFLFHHICYFNLPYCFFKILTLINLITNLLFCLVCVKYVLFYFFVFFSLQDCNRDGRIDCDDYARIHYLGGYRCTTFMENVPYYKKFRECRTSVQSLNG